MSKPLLNDVLHVNGGVVMKTRYWDGIDRPDFVTLEELSPNQARAWAQEIVKCADAADEFLSHKARNERAAAESQIVELRKQIASIEARFPEIENEGA